MDPWVVESGDQDSLNTATLDAVESAVGILKDHIENDTVSPYVKALGETYESLGAGHPLEGLLCTELANSLDGKGLSAGEQFMVMAFRTRAAFVTNQVKEWDD